MKGYDTQYVTLGFAVGFAILLLSSLFPLTTFEVHGLIVNTPHNGPRLYVWGYHIHHWMYGIVLIVSSLFIRNTKVRSFLLGLGTLLVIDDAPDLIALITKGEWM